MAAPGNLDRLAGLILDPAFRGLGAQDLRALLVLLVHTDRVGVAWPTVRRVAELAHLDHRDARRALQRLAEAGLVEVLSEARGRRSRRYQVVPRATDGGFLGLRRTCFEGGDMPPDTDDEAGGDAPPACVVEGGESTLDSAENEGGDAPPARFVEGGLESRRGGSGPPVAGGSGPPRTSEPQNLPRTRTHAREGSSRPTDDAPADPGTGHAEVVRVRGLCLERLAGSGHRLTNRLRERAVLDRAIGDGLELDELDVLVGEAERQGENPTGLLWTWLGDVGRWRAVLADAGRAAKERALRDAPRAEVVVPRPIHQVAPRTAGGGW